MLRERCTRCAGPMFPDEDGDCVCLLCGERIYDWLSAYTDRLLDAMQQQALRDELRERVRRRVMAHADDPHRRWDAVAGRTCGTTKDSRSSAAAGR
jgi:uncharacterized Zn finger protein (UPF0148 family)